MDQITVVSDAPQKHGVSAHAQTVDTRPFFWAWVRGYVIEYTSPVLTCRCQQHQITFVKEKRHDKGVSESDLDPIPGQKKTWKNKGLDNSLFLLAPTLSSPLFLLHLATLLLSPTNLSLYHLFFV